jgi:hypothetical protein
MFPVRFGQSGDGVQAEIFLTRKVVQKDFGQKMLVNEPCSVQNSNSHI